MWLKNIEVNWANWDLNWKEYLKSIYNWEQSLSKLENMSKMFDKILQDNPQLNATIEWQKDIDMAFDRLIQKTQNMAEKQDNS